MTVPFDLIVIGGGVNGAGIARDAQLRMQSRGGRVLLLEARDLASGTSSASTKLVHGGLRYLEYYEFGLVREALRERGTLWVMAPHIVHPMRFVLPWMRHLRPRWMLRLGLFLYDHIAGRRLMPKTESVDLTRHAAGRALKPDFTTGFEYSDGWVDDARLVVLNALDAAERGADIRTRTPVTAARRVTLDGENLWEVETPEGTFHGRALVNAAGPAADDVARMCGEQPRYGIRRVRGSHIVTKKLFDHEYAYIFQLPDTRIVFAIPYERDFTLIGTTDRDHGGSLNHVEAAEDEIAYLCEAASRYFARPVTREDVVWTYAGVRALVDDGSGRPEAATRGYKIPISPPEDGAPLLGVYGGKITSYRHLAEAAVEKLRERVPALDRPGWTHDEPLPGGYFLTREFDAIVADCRADHPFLAESDALRITRAYGLHASRWLGEARSWDDLGRRFGAGLSEAEIRYMCEVEWAETAEDVLWRRSKLGLHMNAAEREAVAEYMGG